MRCWNSETTYFTKKKQERNGENLHLQPEEYLQLPLHWTFQEPKQAVVGKLVVRTESILKPFEWSWLKMLRGAWMVQIGF